MYTRCEKEVSLKVVLSWLSEVKIFFFLWNNVWVHVHRVERTKELHVYIGSGWVCILFMQKKIIIQLCRVAFLKVVFFFGKMLFMEYVGKGYFLEQLTLVRYAYFVWYGEFVSSCLELVG